MSFVTVPFAYAEEMWYRFDNPLGRYAQAFMVAEVRRRWTRAAIALRQYRLQQGSWPARLSDLATVGVSATDIEVQPGYPMGYRVADDVAELWLPRLDRRGDLHQRLGDTPHTGDGRLDYRLEDRLLELR